MGKTRLIILSVFVIALTMGASSAQIIQLLNDPEIVESDVQVNGKLLVKGVPWGSVGFQSALQVLPEDPLVGGIYSASFQANGISGSTRNGNAVHALSSGDGNGVYAVAMQPEGRAGVFQHVAQDGIALEVRGKIVKQIDPKNRITIYDDSGAVVGSWFFSFE
ncbi:MAG: hypothetical protein Q8L20_10655 [Gammaproteobacteria bacterium]|nr:hypothetical protein [Gammaproteobacteria bacterium]